MGSAPVVCRRVCVLCFVWFCRSRAREREGVVVTRFFVCGKSQGLCRGVVLFVFLGREREERKTDVDVCSRGGDLCGEGTIERDAKGTQDDVRREEDEGERRCWARRRR